MRLGLMLILLAMAGNTLASQCYPQLHNDIITRDGNVRIVQNGEVFTIDDQGMLKFDVHKVSLREEQKKALADYHKMLVTDLPYMRLTLRDELNNVVRHVDSLLVEQLGAQSQSRRQLAQFHQQVESQVNGVFGSTEPQLKHQQLLDFSLQFEGQVRQLMINVGVSGMKDLALQPIPEGTERLVMITERLAALQNDVEALLRDQQPKVVELTANFCQRLAKWEQQEVEIQSLIPALKDWRSVTLQ